MSADARGGERSGGGEKDGGEKDGGEKSGGEKSGKPGNGQRGVDRPMVNEGASGSGVSRHRVYGKPGSSYCMICRSKRDHSGRNCPGFACRRCGEGRHLAKDCTKPWCCWCEALGHATFECEFGGANFCNQTGKRGAGEQSEGQPRAKVPSYSGPSIMKGVSYAAATSQVVVQPKRSLANQVSSFLDEVDAESHVMSRDEYLGKKKEFEGRKLRLRQEYERRLAVLESEEKEVDADFEAAEQVQRALKHLAEARAVLSARSTKPAYGRGPQPAHAALVDVPAATSVAVDDSRIGQEESQTPTDSRSARGNSSGGAPGVPVARRKVVARLEVSEVELREVKVLTPVVVENVSVRTVCTAQEIITGDVPEVFSTGLTEFGEDPDKLLGWDQRSEGLFGSGEDDSGDDGSSNKAAYSEMETVD